MVKIKNKVKETYIKMNNVQKYVYDHLQAMVYKRIRVGDVYIDCSYHPCVAIVANKSDDEFEGISLIDGSGPRSCSWNHCGVTKMTIKTAMFVRSNWIKYISSVEENMIESGWWTKESSPVKMKDWNFVKEQLVKNGFENKIKFFERYLNK